MSIFTKWLFQHVKREYKVVYVATGFMGNRYDAGVFEFKVSDRHLNKHKVNAHTYGFYINKQQLIKHFKVSKSGNVTFISANIKQGLNK